MRLFPIIALTAALCIAAPLFAQEPVAKPTPAPTPVAAPFVEEKATDAMFPKWIQYGKGEAVSTHHLAGLGVRKKTIFRVKVYAFGFYLDSAAAAAKVKPLVGRKLKDMMKDRKLDAALLDDSFGKTIRLVMARDVDADDMAEAFEDSLKSRIKKYTAKMDEKQKKAATDALTKFRGYFKTEAKEDQILQFTWLPGGRLQTKIDGKVSPEIKNLALCHALFHVYLGNDPISESGKEKILKGLPTALANAKAARN
jgi:chalcone isomerase-like protein